MRVLALFSVLASLATIAQATIFQNEQVRDDPYPGQATIVTAANSSAWRTYPPNATEISYKGRWDSRYISWWSAPGIKFGFTGDNIALSFGQYTSQGVLLAWRLDGQDWQFANVTANSTYQFVSATLGANLTQAGQMQTFEMRVTNWGYGVQLTGVKTSANGGLVKLPNYSKTIEIIGDSLSSGYTATYEGISSWAWGFTEGLGNVEFSITVGLSIFLADILFDNGWQAFPGICLYDQECFGNPRGQTYQWYRTSDTSGRAQQLYGDNPPEWNFAAHPAADMVVINIGTNDNNTANNVSSTNYYNSYIELIDGIHRVWPNAQIVLQSLWIGWSPVGNTYEQALQLGFRQEIVDVVNHYASGGDESFVHYFNTTGILQHNDNNPAYHPTDVGHIKVASHMLQYAKLKFGYVFEATGPEVQSHTLYWNDEQAY
ncbi:MAG: hypothetical protein Q9227_001093 [Pyrenula ochraceoflavens]